MTLVHAVRFENPKEFERFKKAARAAYPREYIESLVGRIKDGVATIVELWPVKHKAHPDWCETDLEEINRHRSRAASKGLMWLGDLHTHPDVASSHYLSKGDHDSGLTYGALIIGSCKIAPWGKGIRVWPPFFAVPALLKVEGLNGSS